MKKNRMLSGALALVSVLVVSGCSVFETGEEPSQDSFYRPLSSRAGTQLGGGHPGEAELKSGLEGETAQPSPYAAGSGLDANTYDGFGAAVPGVAFVPLYFAFDQFRINAAEQGKVDRLAAYLKSNPNYGVVIEGNCDIRGSEEYNRTLGESRALAVQEQLLASGIAPRRVKTVSNGESKLAAEGNTEEAHRLNRRDEFIVVKLLQP